MVIIEFKLFCTLEWRNKEGKVYANTKEEALKRIDKEFPLKFRNTPYKENVDSLVILDIDELDSEIEMSRN